MKDVKGTNNDKNVEASIEQEVAKETGDNTALVAQDMNKTVVTTGGQVAYIKQLLDGIKKDFMEQNAGLDMDFVYMGTWLVMNKKGNFVEKDDEAINYGDKIDVVIGQGEKRWSLWGMENSPEAGQLIVAHPEKEKAIELLTEWLEANPEAASRYSIEDLGLRYMAFVVPVNSLGKEDEMPKIYLMSFSPTNTLLWGRYAMKVFNGGFAKTAGIKARTGANRVITRLETEERKGQSNSISYIGLTYNAVGMFNPEDFGIKPDGDVEPQKE